LIGAHWPPSHWAQNAPFFGGEKNACATANEATLPSNIVKNSTPLLAKKEPCETIDEPNNPSSVFARLTSPLQPMVASQYSLALDMT